jgi:rhamnulose-1-phosphate aldolase
MKSILEGRPDLAREINKVAEVAGYLWQKGWAPNLTLYIIT